MVVGAERNWRLVEAIHALRGNFDKQVRVHDLAALAGLSPTAFHRQFKAMTAMTPVQFQKQIRLMEARRLMLSREMSAETVAFEVGYASPSQLSREYARLFGAPPRRDISESFCRPDGFSAHTETGADKSLRRSNADGPAEYIPSKALWVSPGYAAIWGFA
ncbi:helix-turn-helix domain-containing protein [Bradyrhizobium frederickii]|nr:AraC family transcriptional regulator [Bradyrhizobium frederickii]